MQGMLAHGMQTATWSGSVCCREQRKPVSSVNFSRWNTRRRSADAEKFPPLRSSFHPASSPKNSPASVSDTGSRNSSSIETLALQVKSRRLEHNLNGRCVYLVGLMGSGKTTVGKIIAQELGYSFVDSDSLIEQTVEETSVADIFKIYGEPFFRDKETQVLKNLSSMRRAVVSTGGGAVIRPINWRYMRKGITLFLEVPVETLARRIATVGTSSRPLLHSEGNDSYAQALHRLRTLWEERSSFYANADARVSLENIAAKHGYKDVSCISPAAIALEALEQIQRCIEEGEDRV